MEETIYNLLLTDNKTVPVHIQRKPIRNYYIKISPDLNIIVSMPLKMDMEIIFKFLNSHKKWIEKNITKFQKAKEENIKDNLVNGGTVKILDSQYIVYIYDSIKDKVVLDGFNIYIYSKKSKDMNYLQKQYNNFLKSEAKIYFQKIINKFLPIFQKYDVPVPAIKIKPMKSKWGSCKPITAEITLNLHLYKVSDECINYVILHELTHLIHPGHKKRFYNFLQKYMPNYQEIEKQLDIEAGQVLY